LKYSVAKPKILVCSLMNLKMYIKWHQKKKEKTRRSSFNRI